MTTKGKNRLRLPLAALALCGSILAVPAMADEIGQEEYMTFCSSCHGETALGDGPVAQYINVPVPSLTTLAQQNDGVFPFLEVIQVVDGRSGVGPHGTLMPVWGDRFRAASIDEAGVYGAEVIVRGRILSLVTYLASIQE